MRKIIIIFALLFITVITYAENFRPKKKTCAFYLNQLLQVTNASKEIDIGKKFEGEVGLEIMDFVLNFRHTIRLGGRDITEIDIETLSYFIEIKTGRNLELKQSYILNPYFCLF